MRMQEAMTRVRTMAEGTNSPAVRKWKAKTPRHWRL